MLEILVPIASLAFVFLVVREMNRYHRRERDRLLAAIDERDNRLMYLVGRAWSAPPRATLETPKEEEEGEVHEPGWVPL